MKIPIIILAALFLLACSSQKDEKTAQEVVRYGWVIQVKPEKLDEYKALHANPWSGVNKMIRECNIRNYSIYYRDGYLFSYFEYTGKDFEADMQKMALDSLTQEWWKLTDPCQEPFGSRQDGEWWAGMEEFFHTA